MVVNLACLLSVETVEIGTRQVAALTLKPELEKYFVRVNPQTIEHVKQKLSQTFVQPGLDQRVAKAVSQLMS